MQLLPRASGEDWIMKENNTASDGDDARREETAKSAEETGLVLDDELDSAASPFLYLLTALLIAVAGYFVYWLLHG